MHVQYGMNLSRKERRESEKERRGSTTTYKGVSSVRQHRSLTAVASASSIACDDRQTVAESIMLTSS